jgi:hypothetical protein
MAFIMISREKNRYLFVGNPSLGDSLSYTFPLAVGLGGGGLVCTNPDVCKVLGATPYFSGDDGEFTVLTGSPGWSRKKPACDMCSEGVCFHCGKSATHHRFISDLKNCYGEWYGFVNPLSEYIESSSLYRPRKITETWGIEWKSEMTRLDLKWYSDWKMDFGCSDRTILLNLQSASRNRCLEESKDEIVDFLKDWDVRFLDFNIDVRSNMFLINQAKHIVTVDTSTVWLAKYLGHENIHVISPGLLNRYKELGCKRFITDDSQSYKDIDTTKLKENLLHVFQ